jgi:hypothetical protein
LYDAEGQVIGKFSVFTLNHITWRDGNGLADANEIRSSVEQFA